MLEEFYNKETHNLTIPWNFDEELHDLPQDLKVIVFEHDFFAVEQETDEQSKDCLIFGI